MTEDPVYSDFLEFEGWEVPKHWEFGTCEKEFGGCGRQFDPPLPKQYMCRKCRNKLWNQVSTGYNRHPVGPIGRWCEKRGLTLSKAARAIGIVPSTILGWDQGRKPKDAELVKRLAGFLKCRPDQLFEYE